MTAKAVNSENSIIYLLNLKEKSRNRNKIGICEFIHTDVYSSMSEESVGDSKYFLLFKDDKSSCVYFLKYKSETFEKFKEFENLVFNKFGTRIKTVRADNGTEFCNKTMKDYFSQYGIILETSASYTHK